VGAIVAPMTKQQHLMTTAVAWVAFGVAVFATFPVVNAVAASDGNPTRVLHSFTFETHQRVESGDEQGRLTIDTTGVFVAPSSQDCRTRVRLGGFSYRERAVVAGRNVYLDEGGGFEAVAPGKFIYRELCPSDPAFWEGMPDFADVLDGVPDTRNGVKVERFDVMRGPDVLRLFVEDAAPDGVELQTFRLYIAREGHWPVAIETRVTGTTDEACSTIGGNGQAGIVLTAPCSVARTIDLRRPDDRRLKVRIPVSAELS
jgi:hypothetical protein